MVQNLLRTFATGQQIIAEGTPGTSAYLLKKGEIDVFVKGRHVGVLSPPAIFGELALLKGGLRTATCVAKSYCQVYELTGLSGESFYRACMSDPAFLRLFVDGLVNKLLQGTEHSQMQIDELRQKATEAEKDSARLRKVISGLLFLMHREFLLHGDPAARAFFDYLRQASGVDKGSLEDAAWEAIPPFLKERLFPRQG